MREFRFAGRSATVRAIRPAAPSTNPIERLNGEIKRRAEVVGILPVKMPSSVSSVRFFLGSDEWIVQHARHMTLETPAPLSNDPIVRLARRGKLMPSDSPETRRGAAIRYP